MENALREWWSGSMRTKCSFALRKRIWKNKKEKFEKDEENKMGWL